MLVKYHKIPTLFEREVYGEKKLIEGKFRNKSVEALRDVCWEFTEKIDGMNIRVYWDGHNVSFAGRTDKAEIPSRLMNYLELAFGGLVNEELFEQIFGEKEVILFGEGYGHKIGPAGYLYSNTEEFRLFDVMVDGAFLPRDDVRVIARNFDVEYVPVLGYGTLDEAIEIVKSAPMSKIGNLPIEGIVARPMVELTDHLKRRIIVKIKVVDFKIEETRD